MSAKGPVEGPPPVHAHLNVRQTRSTAVQLAQAPLQALESSSCGHRIRLQREGSTRWLEGR